MEGMKTLDAVADEYVRMWTYYAGDLPEYFSGRAIKRLIETTSTDYRIRLARKPVNALANRVSVASITSSSGDRVNRVIENLRTSNDMELQEPFLHTRLFAFGDAYMFVFPVDEDEDTAQRDGERIDAVPDADTRRAGVEFAYQSPISCRAFYDAEDGRRIRFVVRRWREVNPYGMKVWRAEVWYSDRMEPWVTIPDGNGLDEEAWLPYAEDDQGNQVPTSGDNWPEYHDFNEIPIKHARTDLPYGRSELIDFVGVQNLLTKAIATQSSGIESHGWRERYRIADDATILDQARDSVAWDDAANAGPASVKPPSTERRSGPGTEQVFHGTKAVGEFAAPDLGSFTDPIEQWIRLGAAATDTPLYEYDPRTGEQMSGIARKRADAPMKAREENAKRFLLRFWREVYIFGLRLVGISDAGELTINWMPPAVEDDPDWWATATVRRDHGVPQRTILREANYSEEDIEAWEEEQEDSVFLDAGIDRLARLGEAMQALGSGATLLGIAPERVAALIDKILGDAGAPGKSADLLPPPPPPIIMPPSNEEDSTDAEA
jgi:hypothetical protein